MMVINHNARKYSLKSDERNESDNSSEGVTVSNSHTPNTHVMQDIFNFKNLKVLDKKLLGKITYYHKKKETKSQSNSDSSPPIINLPPKSGRVTRNSMGFPNQKLGNTLEVPSDVRAMINKRTVVLSRKFVSKEALLQNRRFRKILEF